MESYSCQESSPRRLSRLLGLLLTGGRSDNKEGRSLTQRIGLITQRVGLIGLITSCIVLMSQFLFSFVAVPLIPGHFASAPTNQRYYSNSSMFG